MFIKDRKKTDNKRYVIGKRLSVKRATSLLLDKRYQFYIEQVKNCAGLPDEHFNEFYRRFLERFVEFVQFIPESITDPLGNILTNGLLRGANTLHIFVNEFEDATPLERFALFTACVLQGVERVVTRNRVLITDEAGTTIKFWQPFSGSLVADEAHFYKIIPLTSVYQRMEKSARITLARQILGESAFLSIASDYRLLMEWWQALLDEEGDGSSRLQYAIRLHRGNEEEIIDELPLEIELLDSPATEHGDAFLEWLINGLEDGSIETNTADAFVHTTEMGVFVADEGFNLFAERYNPGVVDQFAIQKAFEIMINKAGIATEAMEQQHSVKSVLNPFAKKVGTVHKGVLLYESAPLTKSTEVSKRVKLPQTIKKTHSQNFALAAFNTLKSTVTMRNR